jgi:membrane associated rhomboid family serine protease
MNSQKSSVFFHSFIFSFIVLYAMWLVKICEVLFKVEVYYFGIYPLYIKGLIGIFLSPLIHGSWQHLVSNTIPFIVVVPALFYYFRTHAYRIFFTIYFATGLWVWVYARASYHIGMSGVVYGVTVFLLISSIIRKNRYLSYFGLFIIFYFGSMLWGLLPINPSVSHESHIMGSIAGVVCAVYFKNIGLKNDTYTWQQNPSSDDEVDFEWRLPEQIESERLKKEAEEEKQNTNSPINIIYTYKENKN